MTDHDAFADAYIDLRSETVPGSLARVEKALHASQGVYAVHVCRRIDRTTLTVAYDPQTITDRTLLGIIQQTWSNAVRIAVIVLNRSRTRRCVRQADATPLDLDSARPHSITIH